MAPGVKLTTVIPICCELCCIFFNALKLIMTLLLTILKEGVGSFYAHFITVNGSVKAGTGMQNQRKKKYYS